MILEIARFVSGILLVTGALFGLFAAVGMLRMPDLYTRMHAASKAGTLGAGLMLVSIIVVSFDGPVLFRGLIGIGFLLLTTPIAAHLLAKAAYTSGSTPSLITRIDQLCETTKVD